MAEVKKIAEITIRHGYFGDLAVPILIEPLENDPSLTLRISEGRTEIWSLEGFEVAAETVLFGLVPTSPEFLSISDVLVKNPEKKFFVETDRSGSKLVTGSDMHSMDEMLNTLVPDANLTEAAKQEHAALIEAQATAQELAKRLEPSIGVLRVTLKPGAGALKLELVLEAVATHWVYHIIGGSKVKRPEIRANGPEIFEDLGETQLPDGTQARVLRSSRPIPLSARPTQKLALVDNGGSCGPRVLVQVLPTASPSGLKTIKDDAGKRVAVSDIYVNLW